MKKLLIVAVVLACTWIGCNNDNGTQNDTPSITSMTPNQVENGQKNVQGTINGQALNGVTAVDLGAGITISDFHSVSATQVAVTFTVDGNANAGGRTVSVTTAKGPVAANLLTVVVNNKPPIANFKVDPGKGDTNTVWHFDASKSRDPDGRITSYDWEFNDGSHRLHGKEVDHKFTKVGKFTVGLTVTDNKGLEANETLKVNVEKVTEVVCQRKLPYKRIGIFGTVLAVDGFTYTFKTDTNQNCGTAFYKCGDFSNPSETEYYGTLCTMTYLGNNTFRIGVKKARLRPPIGQRAFIKSQDCKYDPCK